MKEAKFFSVGNDFRKERFDAVCAELDRGETVRVSVDCIGHSRNNDVQEDYREALVAKYGERLTVKENVGVCRYSYTYSL